MSVTTVNAQGKSVEIHVTTQGDGRSVIQLIDTELVVIEQKSRNTFAPPFALYRTGPTLPHAVRLTGLWWKTPKNSPTKYLWVDMGDHSVRLFRQKDGGWVGVRIEKAAA
jgi:hypothetical protein